jgi:hypothetical protein
MKAREKAASIALSKDKDKMAVPTVAATATAMVPQSQCPFVAAGDVQTPSSKELGQQESVGGLANSIAVDSASPPTNMTYCKELKKGADAVSRSGEEGAGLKEDDDGLRPPVQVQS